MQQASAVISVKNLYKKYRLENVVPEPVTPAKSELNKNEFWALHDVSFNLQQGDVLGIIGKNGAGKSTLLQLLSDITRPTQGSITIVGTTASILDVGTGFHPDLTGRENIYFSGTLLGIPKQRIKQQFDEIVAFSEIGAFIDTPVKHYSAGMYVRLATAVALNVDVKVLLLDEVFSAGDISFKHKVFRRIESLTASGTTIVMITHNMNDVMQFCNKCLLLEKGRTVLFDAPGKCIAHYIGGSLRQTDYMPGKKQERPFWATPESAPGTPVLRLHCVKVIPVAKTEDDNILITDDFDVEVQFWKLDAAATIQLHMVFFDKLDNPVFSTAVFYNQSGENVAELYKGETGLFKMTCRVPGNFLYAGNYSLQLRFGKNVSTEEFIYKNNLHFAIHPNPGVKDYIGDALPIAVRPAFLWKHQRAD